MVSIALLAAIGAVLLLVAYMDCIPASITHGWRYFALVVCLPLVGPLWFCQMNWDNHKKTGWQLVVGAALILVAIALLYGLGPTLAERALASS